MKREHGETCRCAGCRHARFQPGPATTPRRVNFYGHFARGKRTKTFRAERGIVVNAHGGLYRDPKMQGAKRPAAEAGA